MRVEHEICSTICGTPVRPILDHKNPTGLARWGQGRKKSAQEMASVWLRSPPEAPKCSKDPWNGPYVAPLTASSWFEFISGVLDPFRGTWSALKPNWGHFLGRLWPSLTPPANQVWFLWSKMGRTCVPHKVLHILCSTRIYWEHFRPSEVFGRFEPILY